MAISPGGGTVFVTGNHYPNNYYSEYATVAYNQATGAQLWARTYNDYAPGSSSANGVAVSADGRTVFVTGASDGSGTYKDYATIAYSAATGDRLWLARYDGPAHDDDTAYAIAASPDGRTVFVTGASRQTSALTEYATVAYNAATGDRIWVQRYAGPANGGGYAAGLAVSPDGKAVYVTGAVQGNGPYVDYGTIAYSALTGARLWVRLYQSGYGDSNASRVAVSPGGGTVIVTGGSDASGCLTVAYSAATGTQLWARTYNGAPGDTAGSDLAVTPSGGTVVVGGRIYRRDGNASFLTIGYNTVTGARLWLERYTGPVADGFDAITSVGVSPDGKTAYVTGQSPDAANTVDYTTIAYGSTSGAQQWLARYRGSGVGANIPAALAINPVTGTVLVTGQGSWGTHVGLLTVAYHG